VIDRRTSKDKALHLICDNYATHRHPNVKVWLSMVERFFRSITVDRLRAGVFQSVDDLEKVIAVYITAYNKSPRPFVWKAKVSDILQKVMRAKKGRRKEWFKQVEAICW